MYNQIVSILSSQITKYLKVKNDYSILKCINLPNQYINDISKVKSSHVNAYFTALNYSTPISPISLNLVFRGLPRLSGWQV